MKLGTKIPSHKDMSKKKDVIDYLNPDYVYIPLASANDMDITVLVKKGDYVYKGSMVGKRKGNLRIPILSSVSGTVEDFVERTYSGGRKVKCVKIQNDKKEKEIEKKKIMDKIPSYTKKEFVSLLRDSGIVGMGGAGFPTYVKYDTDTHIKTLIVNAVECEPYITSDAMLLKGHAELILEGMEAIMEICHIEEAFIAIKKENEELNEILSNLIGSYVRIHIALVPNLYPMGWEKNLVRYIKHTDYEKLPLEKGIVINNVGTIYAIYEALKYQKGLTERIVTFTGEMLKQPCNVKVKMGTEVREVLDILGGYKRNKDITFIAGGPMMGSALESDDLVIDPTLNCVLVLKHHAHIPKTCLRCGKCVKVCPVSLSPVLIKDNVNDRECLKGLEVNRCIQCGLCSYICPSKIDVRAFVQKAREEIKKEG